MNWKDFFTPRYVLHLEREVEHLRGSNAMLLLELKNALVPPIPVLSRRLPPKFVPPVTKWEAYLAEQIALQEKEDTADGTHSSGR